MESMKMRNPIVLSDQIQLTASGSTEVSSFVQTAKILHYRLGGKVFPAHMYSFKKGDKALMMMADDVCGGRTEAETYLLAKVKDSDEVGKISLAPIKQFSDITTLCDEVKTVAVEKFGYQYGHLQLPSSSKKNPTYLTADEIATKQLLSFPHDYLQPGSEIDIALAPEALSMTNGLTGLLSTPEYVQAGTKQKCFYTWPGFKNRVITPAMGNHYTLEHIANKERKHWHLHDYFTMVPIMASSGNIMKLRASVELNIKFSIIIGATENSFTDNAADQFNVMLDAPFHLPLRSCQTDGANEGIQYVFH